MLICLHTNTNATRQHNVRAFLDVLLRNEETPPPLPQLRYQPLQIILTVSGAERPIQIILVRSAVRMNLCMYTDSISMCWTQGIWTLQKKLFKKEDQAIFSEHPVHLVIFPFVRPEDISDRSLSANQIYLIDH